VPGAWSLEPRAQSQEPRAQSPEHLGFWLLAVHYSDPTEQAGHLAAPIDLDPPGEAGQVGHLDSPAGLTGDDVNRSLCRCLFISSLLLFSIDGIICNLCLLCYSKLTSSSTKEVGFCRCHLAPCDLWLLSLLPHSPDILCQLFQTCGS
jgi:hypothetical protein